MPGLINMSWDFRSLTRFSSDGALTTNLHESWAGRKLLEALNQLPPVKYTSTSSADVSLAFWMSKFH